VTFSKGFTSVRHILHVLQIDNTYWMWLNLSKANRRKDPVFNCKLISPFTVDVYSWLATIGICGKRLWSWTAFSIMMASIWTAGSWRIVLHLQLINCRRCYFTKWPKIITKKTSCELNSVSLAVHIFSAVSCIDGAKIAQHPGPSLGLISEMVCVHCLCAPRIGWLSGWLVAWVQTHVGPNY